MGKAGSDYSVEYCLRPVAEAGPLTVIHSFFGCLLKWRGYGTVTELFPRTCEGLFNQGLVQPGLARSVRRAHVVLRSFTRRQAMRINLQ